MVFYESLNKKKLIIELEFLRKHYDRLAELMGVENKARYKCEHHGRIKFIDYLILRIKDKDFDT